MIRSIRGLYMSRSHRTQNSSSELRLCDVAVEGRYESSFFGLLHIRYLGVECHHGIEARARTCARTKKEFRPMQLGVAATPPVGGAACAWLAMAQRRVDAIMAPRARALLASAMCCMCCCPMGSSSPSGVPEYAGGREDRPRGHERATMSWARFGRGRWRHLVDARAAPPRR